MKTLLSTVAELLEHRNDEMTAAEAEIELPEADEYFSDCYALESPDLIEREDGIGTEENEGKF